LTGTDISVVLSFKGLEILAITCVRSASSPLDLEHLHPGFTKVPDNDVCNNRPPGPLDTW